MYEDLIVILTGLSTTSSSLQEQATNENQREQMVIEEVNVQKKIKDNVIWKRKNHRRPARSMLLVTHYFVPIFLGFVLLLTILNLNPLIKGEIHMPAGKGTYGRKRGRPPKKLKKKKK